LKPISTEQKVYLAAALPALGFLGVVLLIPLLLALFDTFSAAIRTPETIEKVFSDRLFWRALAWNLIVPVSSLALEAVFGLGMALWFYSLNRGRRFWSAMALIPFAIPEIAYLVTAKLLLREHGYLNSALHYLGLSPVGWLEPGLLLAPLSVILVDAWRVTPIVFLICLAGLERVPESYLEAARVDGASNWQLIRLVQLPLLLPSFLVAMALRAVDAFRIFTTPFVLTGVDGVPVLTSVAYHWAYFRNDTAAGNVPALILAAFLVLLTLVCLAFVERGRKTQP